MDRPLSEVWSTVARFEDKAEYMPRLKTVTILEQSPERLRCGCGRRLGYHRPLHPGPLYREAHEISWKLDHSATDNIAEAEGEYRMYEIDPNRTLITYRSYVDTGRSLPRFIQNYMARRSIPDLLNAIKKRVESSGLWCQ